MCFRKVFFTIFVRLFTFSDLAESTGGFDRVEEAFPYLHVNRLAGVSCVDVSALTHLLECFFLLRTESAVG